MSGWLGNPWLRARGGAAGSEQGSSLPPALGLQDELRTQTNALSRQLVDMEAEKDSATSRARQLQKAVAQSEEGESDPPTPGSLLCSLVLLAAEVGGCGVP